MSNERCNDPACAPCRTLDYIDVLGEAGFGVGEMLAMFTQGIQQVFDVDIQAIEFPIEFSDDLETRH